MSDRRFLEAARGSPHLVEPLGVAGADRLRLAQGGHEIAGAGLALAVEEGAPEGLFHGLLDLGPGVALALRDEPREVELPGIAVPFPEMNLPDLPALLGRRHVEPSHGIEPAEELGRDQLRAVGRADQEERGAGVLQPGEQVAEHPRRRPAVRVGGP